MVSDEADGILVRRPVKNDFATVVAVLEPYREELAGVVVVVESTYTWYWPVDGWMDGLQEEAYRVHSNRNPTPFDLRSDAI